MLKFSTMALVSVLALTACQKSGPQLGPDGKPLPVLLNKRVIVRIDPVRVRSWDHRKLGGPAMPLGGTTAAFL